MPNPVINRRLIASANSDSGINLLTGLTSYWSFDVDFSDLLGINNLTAPNGGVTIGGSGIIDNCAALNNSVAGSVLTHADTASLGAGSGVSFSVSIWTTYDSGHPDSLLVGKWDGTNNDYAILLQGSNNYWIFAVTNLAGSIVEVDTGILASQLGNVGQTKWYHMAAGYDDAWKAIWIQINGGVRLWKSCVGVQRSSAPFVIGNRSASGSTPLGGRIDECSFWQRSLSADEVNLLYNMGAGNQYPFSGSVVPGSSPSVGQDWANRVVINGGSLPSNNSINAINDFAAGLLSDGLAGYLLAANCFAPDSLIAAITPIFATYGLDPWTNNNFVLGDLTVNGLTGNASTKFLDSGFNPVSSFVISLSNFFTGLGGQSVYVYSAPNSVNGFDIGDQDAVSILGIEAATTGLSVTINGNGAGGLVFSSPGNGFYSDDRTAAAVRKTYFASSVLAWGQVGATDTAAFTSYPNFTCWAFGLNNQGSLNVPSNDTISFAGWHVGLTSAQGQKLYNRVQALRVALGGGFR